MFKKLDSSKISSLITLISLAVCVTISGITDILKKKDFTIILAISLFSLFVNLIYVLFTKKRKYDYIEEVGQAISLMQNESIKDFPIPVVNVYNGEIVWNNNKANEELFEEENFIGRSYIDFFKEEKPSNKRFEFNFNDKKYLVIPVSKDDGRTIIQYFFIDITVWKSLAIEYNLTRPSVFMFSIDNYQELISSDKERETAQKLLELDGLINNFVNKNNGILIKTDRDRYAAIIEDRYIEDIINDKFSLLDEVRKLSIDNDILSFTLSVGVSRRAQSFPEGQQIATSALEMAQSRGGDQVALKTINGYDFFGGVNKGIEKRNKVKTRIVAKSLRELIENSDAVFLMGHRLSDYDAYGASISLASAASQLNKDAYVIISRANNMASKLVEEAFDSNYGNLLLEPDKFNDTVLKYINPLLIIVDTHIKDILELPSALDSFNNVAIIDHHRKMVGFIENSVVFYHEPYASSTSEMVTELIEYFGDDIKMTKYDAKALLAGIMLDTKSFSIKTGARTFEAASYLRKHGADPIEARKLFSTSLTEYKEKMEIISNAEIYNNCAIAVSSFKGADVRTIASKSADEMLNISSVDAAFVLFEQDDKICISARSLGNANVQIIMEVLGGGGHQTMAAVQLSDVTMEIAIEKLKNAIKEKFEYEV